MAKKFSAQPAQLRSDEYQPCVRRIFIFIKSNADHKITLSCRDREEPTPIFLGGPFIHLPTPLRYQPVNQPLRAVIAKTARIDEVIPHIFSVKKPGYKCDVGAPVFAHCSTISFLTVSASIRFW